MDSKGGGWIKIQFGRVMSKDLELTKSPQWISGAACLSVCHHHKIVVVRQRGEMMTVMIDRYNNSWTENNTFVRCPGRYERVERRAHFLMRQTTMSFSDHYDDINKILSYISEPILTYIFSKYHIYIYAF